MNGSKAQRLAQALNDFLGASHDVEAAAVVSFDGLTMAAALPDELDDERLGAMSAALLGLGEQAAVGLGRGELEQLFVEGDRGFVFLMSAQDQAVLVAVTSKQAKIGLMLFEMRRAAAAIGGILEQQPADPYLEALAAGSSPQAGASPAPPHPGTSGHDAPAGATVGHGEHSGATNARTSAGAGADPAGNGTRPTGSAAPWELRSAG